ncbi:MAG: ABC transporter permease [Acidobacteria bacterium]|nr:ABC transporter permease [Acidobacteriota bacterium]MCA1639538.1 ABC transporter permease [Acidobacteriota bacterium]
MRLTYIKTSAVMTMREMARNRFALILLFTIPVLFFTLVSLTMGDNLVAFKLASISEETIVEVSAQKQSLIFIGVAAVGLLTSFLAMNLIQKDSDVNRRLILCGYRPSELIFAKLVVLLCVVVLISCYVGAILMLFFRPENFPFVILGFALAGFVHSCYGLLVGAIVRREMEGILLIVLLVNIDSGWLQNPIFYAEAQNKTLIRFLPAYFPSQASIVSAFTDYGISNPIVGSIIYGSGLLLISLAIYFWRMKIKKSSESFVQ